MGLGLSDSVNEDPSEGMRPPTGSDISISRLRLFISAEFSVVALRVVTFSVSDLGSNNTLFRRYRCDGLFVGWF